MVLAKVYEANKVTWVYKLKGYFKPVTITAVRTFPSHLISVTYPTSMKNVGWDELLPEHISQGFMADMMAYFKSRCHVCRFKMSASELSREFNTHNTDYINYEVIVTPTVHNTNEVLGTITTQLGNLQTIPDLHSCDVAIHQHVFIGNREMSRSDMIQFVARLSPSLLHLHKYTIDYLYPDDPGEPYIATNIPEGFVKVPRVRIRISPKYILPCSIE